MSPVGAKLSFEVLEFTATPGTADVAVLDIEGRFSAPGRRRLGTPRLLAEDADERLEVTAADGGDAIADADGVRWRASYAVPLRMLGDGVFALAVGRELLDLPPPDRGEGVNGATDLHVRLARETNALRALADEARAAAAAALGRADSERAERERVEAELRGAHHERDELSTRLGQFEAELSARDEAIEQLRREHQEELAAQEAGGRARADERVAEVEAEAAELRRALKSARADVETLRRERDRAARAAAQRPEAATAPLVAEPSDHPEQDTAIAGLPLPEGEDVGPARPAARANGDRRYLTDDLDVPAPVTPAGATRGRRRAEADAEGDDGAETASASDDVATTVARGRDDGADATAEDGWSEDGEVEGVRVLGRRREPRRKGDEPPVEPLPGTAAIGARHIVPGDMGPALLGPWLARIAALVALVVVVAAVVAVVVGLR